LGQRTQAERSVAIIFPEGTKLRWSESGRLAGFRSKGIRSLIEGAPDAVLLPCAFAGGDRVFASGRLLSVGVTLRLSVLDHIDVRRVGVDEALATAERAIAQRLEELSRDADAVPSSLEMEAEP
jgi:hypothetical protein